MLNPKIKVGADFDTSIIERGIKRLKAEAEALNQSFSGGGVGVPKLDLKDIEAKAASVTKLTSDIADGIKKISTAGGDLKLDGLTEAFESAADAVKFYEQVATQLGETPGMGVAVKQAKDVADHVNRAARAQRDLAKEGIKLTREQALAAKDQFDKVRTSGARGTARLKGQEFDEWVSGGWQSESVNSADAKRKRRDVFRRIGLDVPETAEDAAGGGGGKRGGGIGRWAGKLGGAAGGAITGSISGGGFGIGTILGGAGGLVPVVGPILGPILGTIGGVIDKGLERALAEASDLSDLRHSLGSTAVDFNTLRNNVRHFADGLGLDYNEAAKLAKQFAHTANAAGDAEVGKGAGQAAGFARGFGMDPQAAVQFFATMRHYGSTQNERDSKKLSLSISEAITKGGINPKADEALAAISSYVQTAARGSLTEANVESYASFMSSLTGLSHYGMKDDPNAAASAMGKADAALRQGGAFGEASKNFSLGLYQRKLQGFTSYDMDFLNEQGAFGTVERAFGKDSPAYALAKKRGDSAKMRRYDQWSRTGGDRTVMSMQMDGLKQFYGNDTDQFRKAIQSHFGVDASEASALYQAYTRDNGLGGLQKQLEGAGVNINNLNTKQIASLAELATGGTNVLKTQAGKLKAEGGLSKDESQRLANAMANADKNPEELRRVVLKLSEVHDVTKDEGEKMRQIQSDMANSMQRLATELIPLTSKIQGGILELVKKFVPESQVAQQARQEEGMAGEYDKYLASLKQRIEKGTDNPKLVAERDKLLREAEGAEKKPGGHMAGADLRNRAAGLDAKIQENTPEAKIFFERRNAARRRAQQFQFQGKIDQQREQERLAAEADREAMSRANASKGQLITTYNNLAVKRNALQYAPQSQFGNIDPKTGAMSAPPPIPQPTGGARLGRSGAGISGNIGRLTEGQQRVRDKIIAAARARGFDDEKTAAVLALAWHESKFNQGATGRTITDPKSSHRGDQARGVFQYMAATARSGGFNRNDVDQNIARGVADFDKHYREKGGERGAIASHFTGPRNVRPDGSLIKDRHDGNQFASQYRDQILGYKPAMLSILRAPSQSRRVSVAAEHARAAVRSPRHIAPRSRPLLLNPGADNSAAEAARSVFDAKAPKTSALDAPGFDTKLPGGAVGEAARKQLAVQDIRLDNRVIVLDANGREMGNTVTQSQTRVGPPVPAGTRSA